MLKLSDYMKQALRRREGDTVYRMPAVLYEFYQPDYFPPEGGMFDPADAVALFSEVTLVWQEHVYRSLVMSRGTISKHITGEFNGCSVTFSNVGPDNSKPMSEFVLSNDIGGLRLVIRYIDLDWSATLADSVILYVGRANDPDTTSDEECSIASKEELGSILHEIPKREFRPDDPLGRSPNDPLFEGIRSNTRSGVSYYTEKVTKRFLGFLWHVTKDQQRSSQFSAENDGHLGDVMPWINGRCQMEGIPVSWVDEGLVVRGLYIFAGSKVAAIENLQCQTDGFDFIGPPANPVTILALGDPGGTGTNDKIDISFAELGYLSNSAYVVCHFVGSKPDVTDPSPTLTALVFGWGTLPDASGNFVLNGKTDNPALIARRVLTDPLALGMNPGLISDSSVLRCMYLCDQYIKDETNSDTLAAGPDLATAIDNGDVTRFKSGALINSQWWQYQLDPAGTYVDPRQIPIDDWFPVYPGQPPVVMPPSTVFRRRFTFNAPLTDRMKAIDFLHNMVFTASRMFHKTGQDGRINLDMDRPADASHVEVDIVPGQNYVFVSDIEPWRLSLEGEALIGAGLITSEIAKVIGTEYDPGLGNAVAIAVTGGGLTTLALESGGPTLVGGSPTVPSSAVIVVGGTASRDFQVAVTIDGRVVRWTMDEFDDLQTVAASVAMIINSDKEMQHYILALWDGDVRVRVTSKLGKLLLDRNLTEVHDSQLDSPTVTPTAVAMAGGSFAPGTWDIAYTWQSALGETMISPRSQVTTDATNKRVQTGALTMPIEAASVNWYMSVAPGDSSLRFAGNAPSGSPYTISSGPLSSSRKEPQFNDAGEEVIRCLFNWGPDNLREGTKTEWPLAAKSDAINQVYIEYISAIDDFATKQLTVNDYEHQARTGNVNKFEVNGRGIDSYDQAVRIANAVLAFKRDGNFMIRWTTDEAGLPYEEGDVGCVTDDSGLVRQPVRIEHIEIQPNNDVQFEARIYSSHMMADLTGQKEIAISSPLKYIGGPPPPVTNVVLTELSPVASGDHWVSRVHGTFDFGLYIGRQLAHIYVKLYGETEYRAIDVVAPTLENTGMFDLNDLPRTPLGQVHWLKIVTESAYGKTLGLAVATAYPISLGPPAITLMKIFDNVAPLETFVDILGLTIGVAKQGLPEEAWFGCDLWRDRGYGPERVGTLRTQVPMGHTTDGGLDQWLSADGDIIWVELETGTLSDATTLEIAQGRNNYFVGREKIGVQHWQVPASGSNLWKGTGLVRGLQHTEIFQMTHHGQEDVIQLGIESYFLPCIEPRDVDHSVTFIAVTFMQNFSEGTRITLNPVRGDSFRPYAVTDYEAIRDTSLDWLIHFQGWPTPAQLPAEWYVEIWEDGSFEANPTGMKRRLPVVVGTSNAATLIGSADGEFGVQKNNLYCDASGPTYAISVQTLTKTWTRFDFNIRWIGPDHGLVMPITFHQWIQALFSGVLNRAPTPTEESDWTAALDAAYILGHDQLLEEAKARMTALMTGPEYIGLATDNDTFVNDCYEGFLMRQSEPAGHAFWLNNTIVNGRAQTINGFCLSIEFDTEIVSVLEPGVDPSKFVAVHLQTLAARAVGPPDLNQCPITIQWEAAVLPGTVAERVLSFTTPIFEEAAFSDLRNQVDPGYSLTRSARKVSGRTGPRYTIFLAGTEYRVYVDYVPNAGQMPIAKTSHPSDGFPFPLRLVLEVKDVITGLLCIENVSVAGDLFPATIYSEAQQVMDFGSPQSTIYVKIYQRGKYANLQGFPIYLSATSAAPVIGGHGDFIIP